jgi:hypothetical protein
MLAANVSKPIQKLIGIGWIRSADTINRLFVSAKLCQPIPIISWV